MFLQPRQLNLSCTPIYMPDSFNTNCCLPLLLVVVAQVASAKGSYISYALDTKGPEIRTAMLKGGQDIMLNKGGQCCW